jgi:uroporphyrin-III C-methyltransferase/precorrin-2 dehydrogenase/sirohydrochlorin ferrochelatase
MERAMPAALGRLARFAEIFRTQVHRTIAEPRARRLFWDRVFDGRIGELALAGDEIAARRELIRLLDSTRREPAPVQGMVHLVGAGPGDPDLLTLKAHRLLQRADVIVYDRLVSLDVVAAGRRDAERVCVSRDEATQRLMTFIRAGRSVVRLTSGSSVAEFETLWAAGIPVETVPGVPECTPAASSVKSSG